MSSALGYLAQRFFHNIWVFLYDWLVGGFWAILRMTKGIILGLDRHLAFVITLRHFFEPIFGDFELLGRILGFFFRTLRVMVALLVYSLVVLFAVIAYSLWLLLPFGLFYLVLQ
mgnify:CR=1 FL=1